MADQTPEQPTSGKREITRSDYAAIVIAVIALVFAVTNSRSTKVTWIVSSSRAPLFVVIAICIAVGFGAGYLTARRRAKAGTDS